MNTPQSDTPRTDAVTHWNGLPQLSTSVQIVHADFARTLERELNEALEANKRANEAIGNQANENDKIFNQLRADLKMCSEALNQLMDKSVEDRYANGDLKGYSYMPNSKMDIDIKKCLINPRIQQLLKEGEK